MSTSYQGLISGPTFAQNLLIQHAPLSYPPLPLERFLKKSYGHPTITISPSYPYTINLFKRGSSVAITYLDMNIFIIKIMSIQSYTSDKKFIETAHKLGYTDQDLQQITIQKVEQSSINITKNMLQQQRNHYIYKKYLALQDRQNKIITKIKQQMSRLNDKFDKNRKGFNPIIKKLIDEHEMRLQKRNRYDQKVRISKTRDLQTRKINNTIDFGRTSPNFSSNGKNNSRISSRSMRSQNSKASSRSNQSHKSKLELVRLRQKQQQRFKKNLLKYSQKQHRKKVEKVQQNRLSLSRRLKTKSQISQQAVTQKKLELDSIRNNEIRDHIQKLKYKMLKNDYLKQKQQQKRLNQSIPFDGMYKKQLKNLFQKNQIKMNKERYQQKIKAAQIKKKQIQLDRRIQTQHKLRQKKQKQLYAQKYREHMKIQEEQRKKQLLIYGLNDLQKAKIKKQKIQSDKKMKLIENRVKEEIVRSNYNSIENRKKLESQSRVREFDQRMKEISDIQHVKRTLTRQRKGNIFNRMQDQEKNILFY